MKNEQEEIFWLDEYVRRNMIWVSALRMVIK